MHIQFVSKNIDVSPSLRERIEERVESGTGKYFNRPGEAFIVATKEGSGFKVDISLHLPSGAFLQAAGQAGDAYAAAEDAVQHLEKRLRRYKRRLKDHHADNKSQLPAEETSIVVLKGERPAFGPAEDEDGAEEHTDDGGAQGGEDPLIIAESPGELMTMSVGRAVQEMDLIDAPFLVFRNAANKGVNLVYRRPDGNVGWIDPSRGAKERPGEAAE